MPSIRTIKGSYKGERLKVRAFREPSLMHKFLNDGGNALLWRECDPARGDPVKSGTYVWAGGTWHNVKSLDPTDLAHL